MEDVTLNTMPTDALGKPIVIGNTYGYSQQSNGTVWVVIGEVKKVKDLKVTLENVAERRGVWGNIPNEFIQEDRCRSVNACHLFPIHE